MFPLAWGIVETESQSSWTWFLKHLKIDIKTIDGHVWTFMFDKQKRLLNAQLKMAFYSVAKCANEAQMNQRLDEIDDIQSGAKQSLESKDIIQWCRAFFRSSTKCDSVDNNSTEAWNFVLIGARSKPIIYMNEDIREYLMQRRIQKISFVNKWRLDCGPNIRDHSVHLGKMTCSCVAWQLSGIPCSHAIAAIKSRARDPFDYLDNCYSKDRFVAAYSYPIEVVGSEEFWPNSGLGELLPPLPKSMPGRPRKARRRRKYEPKKSKSKLSRHGRDMHCGICNSIEHNSKSCPQNDDASTSNAAISAGRKRKKPLKKTTLKPTKKSA
ncbi:elongation factor G, III-V domain-containing protein [Tanacetum coccineum]